MLKNKKESAIELIGTMKNLLAEFKAGAVTGRQAGKLLDTGYKKYLSAITNGVSKII